MCKMKMTYNADIRGTYALKDDERLPLTEHNDFFIMSAFQKT